MEMITEAVETCMLEAGKAILEVYGTDFGVDKKGDDSPITEADRRAHDIIRKHLDEIDVEGYAGLPFLSEEGMHTPYGERRHWHRYWLVDPLDGTKEFVGKNGEFTVNIALIEDGLPAAGWVFVPVTGTLYWGIAGSGAFRKSKDGNISRLATGAAASKLRIVASRSHLNKATESYIKRVLELLGTEGDIVRAGSSLKLCRIAEGSADLYPRFGPTMEWDTAAAHGVCRAAGSTVIDITTLREMRYNKETLRNNYFLAAPADKAPAYLRAVEEGA